MSLFSKKEEIPYDLTNISILMVEDSLYMQTLFTSMLKVFGVGDIMVAEGAQEAIELLTVTQARRKSRYINDIDIIVTDWLMPRGNGKDLLKWVRRHESDAIRFLPTIVMSAYTTQTVTAQARDLGANETLVKPVSAKALAGRICSVIDHPRSFISAPQFFGPDRRRQELPFQGRDRRVMQSEAIKVHHE